MSASTENALHESQARMRQLVAECVGTFVLVFGGVGSAVLAGPSIGAVGISLAFGLSLLAMVYVIGPISGCHVNPAVTVGLWLRKRIVGKTALGYILAQILGAIVASGLIAVIANGGGYDPARGFGANGYGVHSPGGYNLGAGFLSEVILTFFLVVTVLGATSQEAPVGFAGVAIGFVLTLIHLVGIADHEHLRKSGAKHRSRPLRWRLGDRPALGLHSRAPRRRGARSPPRRDTPWETAHTCASRRTSSPDAATRTRSARLTVVKSVASREKAPPS